MSKSWGEIREEALRRCGQLPPKTNADRIRAMTDEELAKFFFDCVACDDCPVGSEKCKREFANCMDAALDWLKQEADDGQTP